MYSQSSSVLNRVAEASSHPAAQPALRRLHDVARMAFHRMISEARPLHASRA